MQISHESPLCLLDRSLNYNDYDYALVHLFETYPEYYNFFKESLKKNRRVILDNSIFELGHSFDPDEYATWIKKLEPTDYIVPDELGNVKKTIEMFGNFKSKNPSLPSKSIGVVHGSTYNEMVTCYNYMNEHADKIAINFINPIFELLGDPDSENIWYKMMTGRINFINRLLDDNIINKEKKHHLLGATLPQEFQSYKGYEWIESLDTSNPIVHAIEGVKYTKKGLKTKRKVKLIEFLTISIDEINLDLLYYNIAQFKGLVNENSTIRSPRGR
jgi:hypothetical protein